MAECISANMEIGPVISGVWIPSGDTEINNSEFGWGLVEAYSMIQHPTSGHRSLICIFTGVNLDPNTYVEVRDDKGVNLDSWLKYSNWRYSVDDFSAIIRGGSHPKDEPIIIDCDMDPVHMVTGNYYLDYTDFSLHGSQPLHFTRHYNSNDARFSDLGYGWRHNYMY